MAVRTHSGRSFSQSTGVQASSGRGVEDTVSLRLFQFNWVVIAITLTVFAISVLLTDFRLRASGWSVLFGIAALYGLIGYLNAASERRGNPRIYFTFFTVAQMTLVVSLLTAMSYIAASTNLPLQDTSLLAFDRALGLDFRAYLDFINARPTLISALAMTYNSLQWQTLLVVIALPLIGHHRRAAEFTLAFAMTLAATIVISTLVPATGVYGTLGLKPEDYPNVVPNCYYMGMREIPAVRDGTLRLLDVLELGTVLTFPSFHAISAVLYGWAFWPVRWLRTAGMLWNGVMVISTPVGGGHYFVDVFAGLGVAALSICAVKRIGALIARSEDLTAPNIALALAPGCGVGPFDQSNLQGQES
jgi:membrane-associated phospholipid phosphatase